MLTSDRGSAGAFNSNIIRRAQRFLAENQGKYEKLEVSTLGRKGRDFVRRKSIASRTDYPGIYDGLVFERAEAVAREIIDHYTDERLDQVFILFNEFQSAMVQKVTLSQILPIVPAKMAAGPDGKPGVATDYLYEPSQAAELDGLLPRHLAMQIWRAMLESQAGEFGARMSAMDSASKNAGKLIGRMTLVYNRARQASITKELMEIVSGAEAQK